MGTWDFKVLQQPGRVELYDEEVGGSYSCSPTPSPSNETVGMGKHEPKHVRGNGLETIITYDDKQSVQKKVGYIIEKGLGGLIWWESSADKVGSESLTGVVARALEKSGELDRWENWLRYPTSM